MTVRSDFAEPIISLLFFPPDFIHKREFIYPMTEPSTASKFTLIDNIDITTRNDKRTEPHYYKVIRFIRLT